MPHHPHMPNKRPSADRQTEFGKRLETVRKAAGLSSRSLAEIVGCPLSTLSTAEMSGSGSTYTARIARACGVSAYWLETGEGSMDVMAAPTDPAQPQGPKFSPEAENLAAEFDEAPLGRSDKAQVHRLCLALILYGGLPPYTDLVNVKLQAQPASTGTALPGANRRTQTP
jgi:transcriptional regulator with XRE-family HTH domain